MIVFRNSNSKRGQAIAIPKSLIIPHLVSLFVANIRLTLVQQLHFIINSSTLTNYTKTYNYSTRKESSLLLSTANCRSLLFISRSRLYVCVISAALISRQSLITARLIERTSEMENQKASITNKRDAFEDRKDSKSSKLQLIR